MAIIKIGMLLELAPLKPAEHSVMLRGDHGIGKSQLVRQIARRISTKKGNPLTVIDRRLSQMSEGDMVGLPYLAKSAGGCEVTRFAPPDWFMLAVEEPALLFLDELNRSSPEIMQACFQILLDREMNGVKLHPETRVYAAINTSTQYNVNQMDPALLDRMSVYDLYPSAEEWLEWARAAGLHSNILNFIMVHEYWLDPPRKSEIKQGATGSAAYDPTEVHPSRRSWEQLDLALKEMGLQEQFTNPLWYAECVGRIGTQAAIAWGSFLDAQAKSQITGTQVIDDYLTPAGATAAASSKKKKKTTKKGEPEEAIEAAQAPETSTRGAIQDRVEQIKDFEKLNVIIEAVVEEIHKRQMEKVSQAQCENLAAFMKFLPPELRFVFYTNISKNPDRKKFIIATKDHLVPLIVEIFGIDTNNPNGSQEIKTPDFIKKLQEKAQAEAASAQAK